MLAVDRNAPVALQAAQLSSSQGPARLSSAARLPTPVRTSVKLRSPNRGGAGAKREALLADSCDRRLWGPRAVDSGSKQCARQTTEERGGRLKGGRRLGDFEPADRRRAQHAWHRLM